MADYLIAYDIRDPRRLSRVHRRLVQSATPIEYSVFYAVCDRRQIVILMADLASLIDPREDDLRCYPLPERGVKLSLGRATLPAGIHYTGLPGAWLQDWEPSFQE